MAIDMVNRRTRARWASNDLVLRRGSIGLEIESGAFKIGDGVTPWSELPWEPDGPLPIEPPPVEIPGVDLTNYATKNFVTNAVNAAIDQLPEGNVDLTNYATRLFVQEQVTAALDDLPAGTVDLSAYTTKTYVDESLDALLASIPEPSGGLGNTFTVKETASGYVYGDGSPVTTRIPGAFYEFKGLATPPFEPADGDDWKKVDYNIVKAWALKSQDDFNDGSSLTTPADRAMKAKWVAQATNFKQSLNGRLAPNGWSGNETQVYLTVDNTPLAKRQAVEFSQSAYTNTNTKRSFTLLLNTDLNTTLSINATGYSVGMESADGATMVWKAARRVTGEATPLDTTYVEALASTPMDFRVESNGGGRISLLRGGVEVHSWQDPNTTPLDGVHAGLMIYHQAGSSNSASQNIRGENWKAYAG